MTRGRLIALALLLAMSASAQADSLQAAIPVQVQVTDRFVLVSMPIGAAGSDANLAAIDRRCVGFFDPGREDRIHVGLDRTIDNGSFFDFVRDTAFRSVEASFPLAFTVSRTACASSGHPAIVVLATSP